MRVREKNATELTEVQQQSATHPCHATVTREQPLQAAAPSVLACEGDLEKLKNTVRVSSISRLPRGLFFPLMEPFTPRNWSLKIVFRGN